MAAMELLDADTCVTFLFTHSHERKDFKFCVGIGNVRFSRLDGAVSMQAAPQQPAARLKKGRKASEQETPVVKVEDTPVVPPKAAPAASRKVVEESKEDDD